MHIPSGIHASSTTGLSPATGAPSDQAAAPAAAHPHPNDVAPPLVAAAGEGHGLAPQADLLANDLDALVHADNPAGVRARSNLFADLPIHVLQPGPDSNADSDAEPAEGADAAALPAVPEAALVRSQPMLDLGAVAAGGLPAERLPRADTPVPAQSPDPRPTPGDLGDSKSTPPER